MHLSRSRISRTVLLSAVAAFVGFGLVSHASAQKGNYVQDAAVQGTGFFSFSLPGKGLILASLSQGLEKGAIDNLTFKDASALRDFYVAREGKTMWIDSWGKDHDQVAQIISLLEESWTHGLNPASYHLSEIGALKNATSPAEKAQLELLVSDAVVRYAQDISGFRLPGAAINQDSSFWKKPMTAPDVLARVSAANEKAAALRSFAPKDPLYKRLQKEFVALSSNPDRSYEQYLPISFGGAMLRPGEIRKGVAGLRHRMGLEHDPAYGPENKYDDNLAAAVMDFQRENGLSADGVIGSKTLALLNRSLRDRMEQIVANMERLRWIDDERPDKYILVNIPSATLWAVEGDKVAFEMPVIVGRPERQTKTFRTEISGIRFNPQWNVPPTIKAKDFLPKLVEDPNYLVNKGIDVYQVVDGKRQTLDSTSVDWASVTRSDLHSMRMVQAAGDNNALGRIRVLMDNPYDIYLHDTNAPEYFKKPDRAASSGCIRLSDPEAIAKFILAGNQDWSEEKMERVLASGRTTEISADNKLPVYILYQTIWVGPDGNLVYGPDIYKQDKRMIGAMASLDAIHIPEMQDVQLAKNVQNSTFQ